MDLCTKSTCSNADNLVEPPTLSQLSDIISDSHQGKTKVTISKMDDLKDCELEPRSKDRQIWDHWKSNVWNNKKWTTATTMKPQHMKMAGYGVVVSSDLFLFDANHD